MEWGGQNIGRGVSDGEDGPSWRTWEDKVTERRGTTRKCNDWWKGVSMMLRWHIQKRIE